MKSSRIRPNKLLQHLSGFGLGTLTESMPSIRNTTVTKALPKLSYLLFTKTREALAFQIRCLAELGFVGARAAS